MNLSKTLQVLAAAALLGTASAFAGALDEGNAAFQKGDYPAAIRAYETAIAAHGPSAGAYYNLAIAQIKEGQRAQAAVSLHRALMLEPGMADARISLSEIERSQGVPLAKSNWLDLVAEKVPLSLVAGVGSAILWAGMFGLVFLIIRGKGNFGLLATGLVILIFGAALLGTGVLADPRLSQAQIGVIVAEKGAKLLSAPADQSPTVAALPPASSVQVIRKSGDWTYCEAATGEKGWLPSASVERVVPAT